MKKKEQLARKIEVMRNDLEAVIEEEKELINPEVVKASQSLDKVMIQYYRILMKKRLRIMGGAE